MARYTKAERDEAIAELRKLLPPGSTVYTIVTHVARSGMSRRIKLYTVASRNGESGMRWISNYVARALDYGQADRDGSLRVQGCGMDMCFHIVHSLSHALHGYPGDRGFPVGTDEPTDLRPGYTLRKEDL